MRISRRTADVRVLQWPARGAVLSRNEQPDGKEPRGLRELDEVEAVFTALAHPVRRHVLQVLHARGGDLTAGELAARFAHAWPTTTRHLNVLVGARLITVRKAGRERHYALNRPLLATTLDLWLRSLALGVVELGPD